MIIAEVLGQIGKGLLYYAALVVLMRVAGKRLAGQTTTFDLLVLISLSVVLQNSLLESGSMNAILFVVTVFSAHKGLALLCARSALVRRIVRGKPSVLVRDGVVDEDVLRREGLSEAELMAGLRKLGHSSPERVRLAVIEETGHISAVSADTSDASPRS